VSVLESNRSSWGLVNAFDGLPSDTVNVLETQGDTLWIGTPSGLALWNGTEIAGRLPDGVNPSPFANSDVRGVAVLGDSLWIGTGSGAYVGRLSQGLSTWTRVVAGLRAVPIQALVTDGSSLFAMARDSVHRLDVAAGRWAVFTGIGTARGLSHDSAQVYVSMSGGIYAWGGASWVLLDQALRAPSNGRFVITRDATGRTWAAGRPSTAIDQRATGLSAEVPGGPWEFFFPPGPPGNDCLNVEVTGSRVYVTTFASGVGRLDPSGWRHWFQSPRPTDSLTTFRRPVFTFSVIADPRGRVWFGSWAPVDLSTCETDTGAVEIMEDLGDTQQFTRKLWAGVPDVMHSFTRGATVGLDSVVYFGLDSPCAEVAAYAPRGVDYYAPDGTLLGTLGPSPGPLPSGQVWSLAAARDGRIWAGTSSGLVHFQHNALGIHSVTTVTEPSRYVVRGLATYGDTLWALTTTGGLRRYSSAAAEFRSDYGTLGPPASQSVHPLDVAANGAVWVGTSNGLRVHRGRTDSEDYTVANSPIAGDDVRSVRVDRATGYVWIATGGGLSRFDPGYVAPAPTIPALQMNIYPNPVRLSALGLGLKLAGNATGYRGEIYDLSGRRVQRFQSRSNGAVIWNGRDEGGSAVQPGIYFVRVQAGGRTGVARVVVVR
jgi:hypothetical protein